MAKEATKPQTKHADAMMLPSSSQKYMQTYRAEKVGFCCLNSFFI